MADRAKTVGQRLATIRDEIQHLGRDLGQHTAAFVGHIYRELSRRLEVRSAGSEPAQQEGTVTYEEPTLARQEESLRPRQGEPTRGPGTGQPGTTTYSGGQLWQPRDPSKPARKIVRVEQQGNAVYVVWQPPQGGKQVRIQEASFTRWVRREDAEEKSSVPERS